MSNPTETTPTTTPADGPNKLDEALQDYLKASDVTTDPDIDRPLNAVMAEARAGEQPKPAATPAPEAKPTENQHPPRVVALARQFGIPQEDIDGLPTDLLWEEVLAAKQSPTPDARPSAAAPQNPPAGAPASPAPTGESPRPQAGALAIDWGKDADLIDPEVRTVIESAFAPLLAELQAAKAELGAIKNQVHPIIAKQQENAIDRALSGLGLDHILGKGSLGEVTAEEQRRRVRLVKLAAAEGGDFYQSLAAVAKDLYGGFAPTPREEDPEPQPKKPTPAKDPETGRFVKPEEWEQATVQRPTNRKNSPEPRGDAKAARSVHELIVQHARGGGGGYEVNGEFNMDSLPD